MSAGRPAGWARCVVQTSQFGIPAAVATRWMASLPVVQTPNPGHQPLNGVPYLRFWAAGRESGQRISEKASASTSWTIHPQNGPNHLVLWYNMLPGHQIAVITSDCVPVRCCTRTR